MSQRIGDVEIGVQPKADRRAAVKAGEQFADDVGRGAEGRSRRVGGSFATGIVAGVAGGLTSQLPGIVAGFAGELFGLAESMEAIERRATVVFGDSLPAARAEVDRLNESLGMSQSQALGAAAGIQDILVPMGFARDAASDMSLELLELGGALAGNSGGTRTAAEAHAALTAALTGEREQLKAYGVVLNEATVQAKVAEMTTRGLTFATEEQAKAAATLELVTEKSGDAISLWNDRAGTQAEAANEARAGMQEAKEELAEGLAPALLAATELAAGFATELGAVAGWAMENQNTLLVLGGTLAAYKGAQALGGAITATRAFATAHGGLTRALTSSLAKMNPWALAAGAAVGIIGSVIAARRNEEAAIKAASEALRDNTTSLEENNEALLANNFEGELQGDMLRRMGLTYDDVTAFANNNADAQQRVTEAMRENHHTAALVAPTIDRIRETYARAGEDALTTAVNTGEMTEAQARNLEALYGLNTENARWVDLLEHLERTQRAQTLAQDRATDSVEDQVEAVQEAEEATEDTRSELEKLTAEYGALADVVDEARKAIDRMTGGQVAVDSATIDAEQSYADLRETLGEGRGEWDLTTQAGRDNTEAARENAEAIRDLELAYIENGDSAETAASKTETYRFNLRQALLWAGATEEQVSDLIDTYGRVPDEVSTALEADLPPSELDKALAWIEMINAVPETRTTTLRLVEQTFAGSTMRAYRDGGRPPVRRPVVVGEDGPEIVTFDSNGPRVHSAHESRAMASAGALSIGEVHLHLDASADMTNPESARQFAVTLRDALIDLEREDG